MRSHPYVPATTPRRAPVRADARSPFPDGMGPDEFYAVDPDALAAAGVKHVRIRARRDASPSPDCRETEGFSLAVADAHHLRPLPHEVTDGGECRCVFVPAGP